MDAIIDLAPGAEENPLAAKLAGLIRDNLAYRPRKVRDFRALRGSVHVVAIDVGDALTLRFDLGRLTIHDGAIGIPSVTFCADTETLLRLADVPLTPFLHLPLAVRAAGRRSLRELVDLYASGRLKVYGLATHPRLVLRVLRVLSVHG